MRTELITTDKDGVKWHSFIEEPDEASVSEKALVSMAQYLSAIVEQLRELNAQLKRESGYV